MTRADEVPDWLAEKFAAGYVPMDEPPGLEERVYQRWKDGGGRVDPKKAERALRLPPDPSLRDHFAAAALPAVLGGTRVPAGMVPAEYAALAAESAYLVADAMLARRTAE